MEVPVGKPRGKYARQVTDSMGPLLLGIEEDGSIEGNDNSGHPGFEIITQPAGLDSHEKYWNQADLKGLKSHDTANCGTHVHVSRAALTKLEIAKLLIFIYDSRNKDFVEGIGRRPFSNHRQFFTLQKIINHRSIVLTFCFII